MGTQTDYFDKRGYQPEYHIGDRVCGTWNNIPFMGTVGNDRMLSEVEGPTVTVHVDLPIKLTDGLHYVIVVTHKDIKPLKEMR